MATKRIDTPPTLGELIKASRERAGLSLRELAEVCGGSPTASSISAIERGDRTVVTRANLEALATGLRIPKTRLLAAAGRAAHDLGPFVLPPEAAELTAGERKVVRDMVFALLAARRR